MTAKKRSVFPEDDIRFALLDIARDKKPHLLRDLEKAVGDKVQIPQSARQDRKPGRPETKFLDRIRWCRTHLKIAGLISNPQKGYYQITEEGEKFLGAHSKQTITQNDLSDIESFDKWARENKEIKKKRRKFTSEQRQQGLVIMIDALGTKAYYQSKNPDRGKWKGFVENFKQKIKGAGVKKFQPYVVSDTIIIAIISSDINRVLLNISPALEWAIIESMKIERPIRGCISAGNIYADNIQVIGTPVNEAADYYNQTQWIGISACPSAHAIIEDIPENYRYPHFHKFDLPLRNSVEFDAWAVNWTHRTKPNDDVRTLLSKNSKTPDLSVALKWRNTKRFFAQIMES